MAMPPPVAEIESALTAELARLLSRDVVALDRNTPLQELGLDSLTFVSLLVFIERQYGLKLINTPLGPAAFRSLAALAAAIRELLESQS